MKLPKHKNTFIYIISLLLPFVLTVLLGLIFFIVMAFSGNKNQDKETQLMLLINFLPYLMVLSVLFFTVIPLLTYLVLYLIQIYRIWDVINDGKTRATPGKALGFLFIPFYNLYWIFNIWGGFPTDYNAYVERYRLSNKVPLLNPTIYQLFPVLILSTVLVVTTPVLLIYFAFLLNSSNKAIDNLRNAITQSNQQFSRQPAPNMAFQPQS